VLYKPINKFCLNSLFRSVMSLTHGYRSKFPCPICLVPDVSLANISEVHPLCTAEQTQKIVMQAINMNSAECKALLKGSGLHPVQVSDFLNYKHYNFYL
jgi:hypothetical protein